MIKEAYSPDEVFGPIIPISRNVGYEMLRTKKLRSVRCGRRIIIPRSAIEDFLGGGEARQNESVAASARRVS